uniref:Replication protein n=1 Tax=Cygnus columbianus parvo-like hybrid virus TaxID=2794509 RepID=A0A8A4XCB0_9VIRU|nr:MAG: replication protein [Cygnus columbianus parvo-like hybrid virus]
MTTQNRQVYFHTIDRQWDCRFNVPTDEDLASLLTSIKSEWDAGKFKYVLVSGLEIGQRVYQDDYNLRHVHVAVIFNNRVSKSAILKNWGIKQGLGYYLVPRNRDYRYSGWRIHHSKKESKINPDEPILFEEGTLPPDDKWTKAPEATEVEKKRKIDDVLIEMKGMIERDECEEAFAKFPRTYITYGEKIKAMILQRRDFAVKEGNPHMWIYGVPGSGKTALLTYIYPEYYKKNLYNKFFDLYDPKHHTHVILEDLDHEAVETLTVNFLKTLCDEAGFAVDQKFKTPQLAKTTVLVTSNFTLHEVLPEDMPGRRENMNALLRRFWHVNIFDMLRLLQLKKLDKWDLAKLKKEGNTDPGKIFMTWDYVRNVPLCEPLKTPEEYQIMLRDYYFGASV